MGVGGRWGASTSRLLRRSPRGSCRDRGRARRGTRLQFHQIFFYVLLIHSFISLFSLHDGIARDFKYYEVDCQFKFAKRPFEQLYS